MNKYLFGICTGLLGALVVKKAYAKGYRKGIKECGNKLEFIVAVQEIYNKKKDEES